jgi:hypothetical protein
MYGSRELEIALSTLSVAIAACRIADYGEGIMFSVLTSGAAFFAVMCIHQMLVQRLTPGQEHDRQDRSPKRGRSTTSSL